MRKINDDDLITVRNRNNGETGYRVDNGIIRTFERNEIKKVPYKELVELSYSNGGSALLRKYLVIEDQDALEALNMKVEPEYFYTDADIKKVLFKGSYDEFADFLDFAPDGAIEIMKEMAVNDKVPDTNKREMIFKKTGLNINTAIQINEMLDEDNEEIKKEEKKERRVKKEETKEEIPAGRRAAAPKTPEYKVVTKK